MSDVVSVLHEFILIPNTRNYSKMYVHIFCFNIPDHEAASGDHIYFKMSLHSPGNVTFDISVKRNHCSVYKADI